MIKGDKSKVEIEKNNQYKKIFTDLVGRFFNVALIAMSLIIFTVAYAYILKPKYDSVSTVIAKRNDSKLTNQAILEHNINIINNYKNVYKQISQDKLDMIEAILPPFSSNEEFFTTFEEMILKRGYLLTNLSVSSDADAEKSGSKKNSATDISANKDPKIGKITITMNIQGVDYAGMKNFLKMIENNLRIMDIANMSYSYTGETLSLSISTYFLR